MDCESASFCAQYYKDIDTAIKLIALLGGVFTLSYGYLTIKEIRTKRRFEYLNSFQNEFLGREIIEQRNRIADFWKGKLTCSPASVSMIQIPEMADPTADIENILRNRLNMTISVPTKQEIDTIDKNIVNLTQDILNKYELLGKLYESKVVSRADIEHFFYTMIADTFVLCLPYILYRRQSKPMYAHKMQALIKVVPTMSSDVCTV
jgi:hypothetical protein